MDLRCPQPCAAPEHSQQARRIHTWRPMEERRTTPWQASSHRFRTPPTGVVCVFTPSIYDLTKLCQEFLVVLLSFSRISQAIKEPIETQAISRLFSEKKISQITDTATVISPDYPKPESQSIIRTQRGSSNSLIKERASSASPLDRRSSDLVFNQLKCEGPLTLEPHQQ